MVVAIGEAAQIKRKVSARALRHLVGDRSIVEVEQPQDVCPTILTHRVLRSRCDTASERNTSSLTMAPALRMTCASPSFSPNIPKASMRASIQVTIARWARGTADIEGTSES
jgi:hypothetical protein